MDKYEREILLCFLKEGLSTRQIDRLNDNKNTRGWVSWNILKKYGLKKEDKAILFLYSKIQSKRIIEVLKNNGGREHLLELTQSLVPAKISKFRDTFVIATSENKFYGIMSGETRNLIRDFFSEKKRAIELCQFDNCKIKFPLDTVHLKKDRPQIFLEAAKKNKKIFDKNNLIFDVYSIIIDFLKAHSKRNSVCFLCKKHHNELHRLEKIGKTQLNEFKRKINL